MSSNFEYLDEIAKESWAGKYDRTATLSDAKRSKIIMEDAPGPRSLGERIPSSRGFK